MSFCYISTKMEHDEAVAMLENYCAGSVIVREEKSPLTGVTAEQIQACIDRNQVQQLHTTDFGDVCDFRGFTPPIFRPEVFSAKEMLYSASVWSDWISLVVTYQPEDPEYNVVMQIQYFLSVDEVYSNFEQSETGIFLNLAGTTVYCAPNLHHTSYAWVNNTVTYLLSGVLPKETAVPLLDAYFRGDQYTPDSPCT